MKDFAELQAELNISNLVYYFFNRESILRAVETRRMLNPKSCAGQGTPDTIPPGDRKGEENETKDGRG